MILLFKRRREREKALAAENAAKASQSQVPTSSRPSNFEKFSNRTSRSLSPSPSTSKTSSKSKTSTKAPGSSKTSGSTENLRSSSLKLPKSNESQRRKSSGNAADENPAENVNNSNDPDMTEESKPVCTNPDDHLWSSNEQLDRNVSFIPSVGRAKVTYSYEPPQAIASPESPDIPDSNQSLSYLLTSCVSHNPRSSVSSLSPVSEPINQLPTAPKISVEDLGNLPSYDDVMASMDYDDREP